MSDNRTPVATSDDLKSAAHDAMQKADRLHEKGASDAATEKHVSRSRRLDKLAKDFATIEQDAELKDDIRIILSVVRDGEIVHRAITKLLTLCPTLFPQPETQKP